MLVSPLADHWVIEMSLPWRYNSHRKIIFGEHLMKVNRLADLQEYEAPGHFDMKGFRLQGFDASDSKNFWTGLSYFLPGGGTTHAATPLEKVYVGIEGNLTIVTDDDETTLGHLDSVYLAPNEGRSIINRTNKIASILVIMPYPSED